MMAIAEESFRMKEQLNENLSRQIANAIWSAIK